MRVLTCALSATAALTLMIAVAPASSQAAPIATWAASSVQNANVQVITQGCGRHRHRVWRHGRSGCVHN
jgi:hypothetical protein